MLCLTRMIIVVKALDNRTTHFVVSFFRAVLKRISTFYRYIKLTPKPQGFAVYLYCRKVSFFHFGFIMPIRRQVFSMVEHTTRLQNLQDIRQYISNTLSQIDLLQPDSYHLSEHLLMRNGKPCGLFFCLHGPRSVRLTAIWETDSNTILFYGSCGKRIQKTELKDGPTLEYRSEGRSCAA